MLILGYDNVEQSMENSIGLVHDTAPWKIALDQSMTFHKVFLEH